MRIERNGWRLAETSELKRMAWLAFALQSDWLLQAIIITSTYEYKTLATRSTSLYRMVV